MKSTYFNGYLFRSNNYTQVILKKGDEDKITDRREVKVIEIIYKDMENLPSPYGILTKVGIPENIDYQGNLILHPEYKVNELTYIRGESPILFSQYILDATEFQNGEQFYLRKSGESVTVLVSSARVHSITIEEYNSLLNPIGLYCISESPILIMFNTVGLRFDAPFPSPKLIRDTTTLYIKTQEMYLSPARIFGRFLKEIRKQFPKILFYTNEAKIESVNEELKQQAREVVKLDPMSNWGDFENKYLPYKFWDDPEYKTRFGGEIYIDGEYTSPDMLNIEKRKYEYRAYKFLCTFTYFEFEHDGNMIPVSIQWLANSNLGRITRRRELHRGEWMQPSFKFSCFINAQFLLEKENVQTILTKIYSIYIKGSDKDILIASGRISVENDI